jgi:hypothetical protein
MERATGIEPATSAWEADVLPLNYARRISLFYTIGRKKARGIFTMKFYEQ